MGGPSKSRTSIKDDYWKLDDWANRNFIQF